MKIAIHHTAGSFSEFWIAYCNENNIDYKIVDCYESNIMQQVAECEGIMWHFSQNSPKAILFAKQLVYSFEMAGKKVFPDFYTSWHFDDKVGQKYLLEAISAPTPPTWVFYEKERALKWISQASFPKVFKLRGGAGSQNVRLIKTKKQAERLVKKAFCTGFQAFDPMSSLLEEIRRYKIGKAGLIDLAEGLVRFIIPPAYSKVKGREKGYIYLQEYIPYNDSDIRVVVIGDKAFAIKRMVRSNDFRASGSGFILYDRSLFSEEIIELSFSLAKKLFTQCIAFDFVFEDGRPLVVEISYGYSPSGYFKCQGYWDNELAWHEGEINPYGWMVEDLIKSVLRDR